MKSFFEGLFFTLMLLCLIVLFGIAGHLIFEGIAFLLNLGGWFMWLGIFFLVFIGFSLIVWAYTVFFGGKK